MGVFRCKIDDANLNAGADTVNQASCKAGKDYSEGTHSLYVQERDSAGNWSGTSQRALLLVLRKILGFPGISDGAGISAFTNFVTTSKGEPIVAYYDDASQSVIVRKLQAGNWIKLGNLSGKGYGRIGWKNSMAVNPSGIPYILLQDSLNRPTVLRYVQNQWEIVGTPAFMDSGIGEPSIAFTSTGTPYIAFRDNQTGKATAMRYNGTSWELVGSRGFSNDFSIFFSLRVTRSNTFYLAYLDGYTQPASVVVRKYIPATSTWDKLPDFPVHSSTNSPFDFAVGSGDTLFLSLITEEYGSIEVYKFTGSSWSRVGGPVSLPKSTGLPSLSISESGQLFLSYIVSVDNGGLRV
jgi:hypothetical protein